MLCRKLDRVFDILYTSNTGGSLLSQKSCSLPKFVENSEFWFFSKIIENKCKQPCILGKMKRNLMFIVQQSDFDTMFDPQTVDANHKMKLILIFFKSMNDHPSISKWNKYSRVFSTFRLKARIFQWLPHLRYYQPFRFERCRLCHSTKDIIEQS